MRIFPLLIHFTSKSNTSPQVPLYYISDITGQVLFLLSLLSILKSNIIILVLNKYRNTLQARLIFVIIDWWYYK